MARKRKSNRLSLGVFVLLFIITLSQLVADWLYAKIGIPTWFIYAGVFSAGVAALLNYFAHQNRKLRAIQIANIDSMTGVDFERYLQKLLTAQGYSVNITRATGDFGVDLVAARSNDKIAIQVKRYSGKISRHAISDAVAGMQHYRCTKAMVITNNYFTAGAVTLACSTGCLLVDRDTLVKWIVEFQNA